ncbi:MAG: dihydrolipoamide acetyltransferase [Myxococcales bacterium]|nr:dihydrolipoamide acetyltransferase [Myxococcales bacterium]
MRFAWLLLGTTLSLLCLLAGAAPLAAQETSGSAEEATISAPELPPMLDNEEVAEPAAKEDGAEKQEEQAEEAPPAKKPGQPYNLKLREIEERVNELKEKIFQSKSRLIQLQEVVLHGAITGAKAVLVHGDEMGSSFRLWRIQYALDGAPIFKRVDTGDGALSEQEDIEIFNGSIAPGNHKVSVFMEYKGHGYGIFSYLKDYRFKLRSSYTFDAEPGKITKVRIVGYEKGGITTELKDRPSIRFDVETERAQKKE